jgi:AcrR family transcriptional regulator
MSLQDEANRPRPRKRRTQEQRSAETRALLLEVTIDCLAELGYARTTAQVIADRAGLSRGAQLHHFGTRTQLLTAAMEHLFERGNRQFRTLLAEMPRNEDPVSYSFDVLWKVMSGPVGHAYLELVFAARTDPELHQAMVAANRRNDEQVDRTFREFLQGKVDTGESFDILWTAVFALFEGLVVEKVMRKEDARIDRVVEMLKKLAPSVVLPRTPQP